MTDLVKRAKKGDKEAFILLMDHHRQMLYNTALLVLHREDDALDAIQDTILACWENLPSLQKDRYFKTWLVRILLNKCADTGNKNFKIFCEILSFRKSKLYLKYSTLSVRCHQKVVISF